MSSRTRILFTAILILIFADLTVASGSSPNRPGKISSGDPAIAARTFRLGKASEVELKLTASAPGTSWGAKGAEAAVVTCQVDGRYNHDIVLYMGADEFAYNVLLGDLTAGPHRLEVRLNKTQSAIQATSVKIRNIVIRPVHLPDDPDGIAAAHAPILFARPNSIGKYTDIPLLMWCEVFKNGDGTKNIRYSYVFTNEDAGTATEALMARWGRATDIEWAYEIKLKGAEVVEEMFQAVNHQSTAFKGKHDGAHPILIVASDNNNFADGGESAMKFRFVPEPVDLSSHSREELMDRHPWTYRLMAEELYREGKISEAGGHQIRDPREYIYIEANAPKANMGIDLKVEMADGASFDSSMGNQYLRITRPGWFRVAIRLPQNESPAGARRISLDCAPPSAKKNDLPPDCSGVVVQKVFILSNDYSPQASNAEIDSTSGHK